MNKIFGIGMPKTGTTSLHVALEKLGFRSIHFAHDETTVAEICAGKYRLSILEEYDAISDVPIPAIFAQLDFYWPKSKFVLTVRDVTRWLDSCRHSSFNRAEELPKPGTPRFFYRALLYGCIAFHEERFKWVYQSHLRTVKEHFAGEKEDQLLILDLAAGDGWEKLCGFLDVPVPDCDFPHSNRRRTESVSYI